MVKPGGVVAIVPARGGSKSIPRKNIRPLAGVPLLSYSIAAGLTAKLVDRVIVSTDDEEIAAIARREGADVPFLRPASLAGDSTRSYRSVTRADHASKRAESEGSRRSM